MRKFLRKLIPEHAILPLLITGITLILSYQLAKWVQLFTHNANAMDVTLSIDGYFGFQPVWVAVYFGSYFFWIWQYLLLVRESPKLACTMAAADIVAKGICLVLYLALPTTNVRPEVTGNGIFPFLMRLLYTIDTPTNLLPSIHCLVPWMGTRYLMERKTMKHKKLVCLISLVGTFMVFASTLYTKQHVVLDVIAGVAVAEIGWLAARFTPLGRTVEKWNQRFMESKLIKYL